MAYHFDARLDSSSDDDATAPDLAAWKGGGNGGTYQTGRAPVAPMVVQDNGRSPSLSLIQNDRNDVKAPPRRSTSAASVDSGDELGENSVDAQDMDINSIASSEENVSDLDVRYSRKARSWNNRKLVVEISRTEATDLDEYLDCTSGADDVRRILRELPDDDEVMYQALFDDFHVELVCCSSPSPCYIFHVSISTLSPPLHCHSFVFFAPIVGQWLVFSMPTVVVHQSIGPCC
jgi:hypothetical protein